MLPAELDFSAPSRTLTPLGMAVLCTGLLLATSVAVDASDLLTQRAGVLEKQAQLSTRVAELRGAKSSPATKTKAGAKTDNAALDDAETRRIGEAQKVIRALAAPWDAMFEALETAQDENVALLTISPASTSNTAASTAGHLALTGEARNYEALTGYLTRLDDSDGLTQVQLLAHEVKGGERNIVFSATASMRK